MSFYEQLTAEEARVIRTFGNAMQELATGKRRPRSPAQERFVRVCRGEKAPVTLYEIAYVKNLRREQELVRRSSKDQGPDAQIRRVHQPPASNQLSDSTQRPHQPETANSTQRSYKRRERRAQKLMSQMLARSVWLWGRDELFLSSISAQLSEGCRMSGKQVLAVEQVYERFVRNQQPRFVRG